MRDNRCIDCNCLISLKAIRCSKCNHKSRRGKKHTNINTKHHLYLKENSKEILLISSSKHLKLHFKAYEYLVETNQIQEYLKWFDRKYSLGIKSVVKPPPEERFKKLFDKVNLKLKHIAEQSKQVQEELRNIKVG